MNYSEECYYCVCTACSKFNCPWKHHILGCCSACSERHQRIPRLRCDSFRHYLKTHRFKFKRAVNCVSARSGTYCLLTHDCFFLGDYEHIQKLSSRLGGTIRKYNIIRGLDDEN